MLRAGTATAVLGAAGFLGSSLVARLEGEGIACAPFTRATPMVVDGVLDPAIAEADVVFWLVSSIRPATPQATDRAGDDLSKLAELLDLLARRPGPAPRLVAVSSGGTVYDSRLPPPYTEASPTHAVNAYGEAMLALEAMIRSGASNHVVLRVSNAYGPRQPARRGQGVIAHWLDAVLREEPLRVLGDPATLRDYIYVDDLMDALLMAAGLPDGPATPRLINIGSGHGTSLAELMRLTCDVVGYSGDVEYGPARSFDAPSTWVDTTRAREVLGFRPAVELHEGLRRTWLWMQLDFELRAGLRDPQLAPVSSEQASDPHG